MTNESVVSSDEEIERIMTAVVFNNTAQAVFHELKGLYLNRDYVITRWVWELLQNARDAAVGPNTRLVVSIEHNEGEIIFQHDGANFKISEIGHLIYHGSTKIGDTKTIGQYGSGFLATHLLSPEIEISGHLDDGRHFQFKLKREDDSVGGLSDSMDQAKRDFMNSLSAETAVGDFTTQFRYQLKGDAVEAANEGIAALKSCAPFVVVFNQEFSSININSSSETVRFKEVERTSLEYNGLQRVTVSQSENGESTERKYVLAQSEKTSVAVPLATGDEMECLTVGEEVPKLFLGFPLIGTEDFSFPAVINSFDFTPTPNRDGVYIARNINDENIKNQAAIETACELLITLLKFAAMSGWRNAYTWTNIPPISVKPWLNQKWLRDRIEELVIEEIRQNSVILNESGEVIPHESLNIPLAETAEGVESLWLLLDGWEGRRDELPRRNEVVGWSDAARSWATISDQEVTSFNEVIDGRKLSVQIHNVSKVPSSSSQIFLLSRLPLKQDLCGVEWLDKLHGCLIDNGLSKVIREYCIVPSQRGYLRQLPNLHRDKGIDRELKDVADLMGEFKIRCDLRDTQLTFLSDEPGKGDWDNEYVVGELIKRLQEQAAENPKEKFAKASVRLFAWIAGQQNWDLLRDFPVFPEEWNSENERVINLKHLPEEDVRILAPSKAWVETLQPFSELFPRRHILSNDFFEAVSDPEIWQELDRQGFCKKNVIITKETYLSTFLPNEPLDDDGEHETSEYVTVTDIAFLTGDDGIIDRVRQSQRRACMFWTFLTEWLVVQDPKGLDINEALCDCGDNHRYYSAAWLEPLIERRWVPLGGDRRVPVTAQSLADLLRGSGWEPRSLEENPNAVKLLKAIGITRFDLVRAFTSVNDEERKEKERCLTMILDAAEGDTNRLDFVPEYIEDLKDDEALPRVLQERREQRRKGHENQSLGKQVEDLVRANLEREKFVVRRKPIGSDFEIEHDVVEDDKEMGIEVTRRNRTWLIEVKATRDQSVRMTERQARTAKKEGGRFLFCVVPIESDNVSLTSEDVRTNMRFVRNIGSLVAPLCDNLDEFKRKQDITAEEDSGVQLEVGSGATKVRVEASVWKNKGFRLEDLLDRLSELGN